MISFVTQMKEGDFEKYNKHFLNSSNAMFWVGTGVKSYKYNYSIEVQGGSYYIGYWHNSENWCGGYRSLKIQYNPNKIEIDEPLKRLINFCFLNNSTKLKSVDVAFDIPRAFGNFVVDRGRKHDVNIYKGTYYIGARSSGVKIYDKQKEGGLPYPLTRYEIRLPLDIRLSTFLLISKYENNGLPTITFVDTLP